MKPLEIINRRVCPVSPAFFIDSHRFPSLGFSSVSFEEAECSGSFREERQEAAAAPHKCLNRFRPEAFLHRRVFQSRADFNTGG